jgi:hypothetical protein
MRLPRLVAPFMTIWLGVVGVAALALAESILVRRYPLHPAMLIPVERR